MIMWECRRCGTVNGSITITKRAGCSCDVCAEEGSNGDVGAYPLGWAKKADELRAENERLRDLLEDALAWIEPSLGGHAAKARIRRSLAAALNARSERA